MLSRCRSWHIFGVISEEKERWSRHRALQQFPSMSPGLRKWCSGAFWL